ncbi:MAG: HEAT repeat domain-containing protein, partial [Desulfobulbaceae bacterium]|nr:HEAT repeat domain-containing protein [Desulfobulbaceae bacterium]
MNKIHLIRNFFGETDRIHILILAVYLLIGLLNHACSSTIPIGPDGSEAEVYTSSAESLRVLHDPDPKLRREAAEKFAENFGDAETVGELIGLLNDRDPFVRQAAARSLGRLRAREAIAPLTAMLNDADMAVKQWVIWALGRIGGSESLTHLIDLLGRGDGQ